MFITYSDVWFCLIQMGVGQIKLYKGVGIGIMQLLIIPHGSQHLPKDTPNWYGIARYGNIN